MKTSCLFLTVFVAFFTVAIFRASAQVEVTLDPESVACDEFLGFGANWSPLNYGSVSDASFSTPADRVRWMRLPSVRVMMLLRWCLKAPDTYDWDNSQMNALYRLLDVCQEVGATVFLADWGCEAVWNDVPIVPPINTTEDPRYAEGIATYVDYLVNNRGYTCIRYLTMVNEPNWTVGDYARWKTGFQQLATLLNQRGLDQKVKLAAPDSSHGGEQWLYDSVDDLQGSIGAYDVHCYAEESVLRAGLLTNYFAQMWNYAAAEDPQAAGKPFVVGEAGLYYGGFTAEGNDSIDEYFYGLHVTDYAVQAANAGSDSVMAWWLDDQSIEGFSWGMWDNAAAGYALRPWFYPWSLLSRYIPAGSQILNTTSGPDVRVLAALTPKGDWAFCVVNRGETPATVVFNPQSNRRVYAERFLYSESSAAADDSGFPVALSRGVEDLAQNLEVTCPALSVAFVRTEFDRWLDTDGDGLPDEDELRDLDPAQEGVQNPFNPDVADATGDDGVAVPDGIPDGQNDWDGDGMSNETELQWGYNPIDPASYGELPLSRWAYMALASAVLAFGVFVGRRVRRSRIG